MKYFVPLLSLFLISCKPEIQTETETSEAIRINQIGYYPGSIKEFVLIDAQAASAFQVINAQDEIVYSGTLSNPASWDKSGEMVKIGDFSDIQSPGTYRLQVKGVGISYPFAIQSDIYRDALDESIRSFYLQRMSIDIDEKHAGVYARTGGHPDMNLNYHPSTGKVSGTRNSPGGWYDAGDYGKYVINGAISSSHMMQILELYPKLIKDGRLNIPESGNQQGDLLDEIRYELEWILTMQDDDGGVFHKLTAQSFGGFIMPEAYDLERLIIGKGTAATLTLSACMAQASRLYREIDPDFSTKCMDAAMLAWEWAKRNPEMAYRNPEDVRTGEYGGNVLQDNFYWAASEMYVTTGDDTYLTEAKNFEPEYIHWLTNSWKYFIRNMGFHSMLINREQIDTDYSSYLVENHIQLADALLDSIEANPYRIGLNLYEWGSNSDILNQAIILAVAHHLTGDAKYLDGVVRNTDYIVGKNATGYSFLTGFGSKRVMFPHHRPSGADGIDEPFPGFVVGGPNDHRQDANSVTYASEYPAKAFEDVEASYASNEVCLNWNAPAVFVLGYLEQQMQ